MPPSITIRTNASAPDTPIPDAGVVIAGSGSFETFDDFTHVRDLRDSRSLRALATDDAYGSGSSTLILVDRAGSDVAQGLVDRHLAMILEDIPGKVARDAVEYSKIYVGRASGSGTTADAIWQIYRFDVETKVVDYADGDALFDNVWDDRETLTY